MKYNHYISLFLFMFSGIWLMSTVFAIDIGIENGLVIGKVYWFHRAMIGISVSSLIAVVLSKEVKSYPFSLADILVLLLGIIVLLTYDWSLNPEPEKLWFGGQLLLLWFLLRFLFAGWHQLPLYYLAIIIGTGVIEAILGICQLYGFKASNHSLFKLTGDFYNPGPYSGYLAMILPLCLWMILNFHKYRKGGWWQSKVYCYYLAWICLLAVILVLPAGMSRTAWVAATFSCVWVYVSQRTGWQDVQRIINKHKRLTIFYSTLVIIAVTTALAATYMLKKDSADGRLLLWKVTGQAMMEQPWTGVGLGGFPAAYVNSQAVYFASGKASDIEKQVAGCPDYGFNEFLQIGLELGAVGLVVFICLLGYSLFLGIKNRYAGVVGGILSLIIFAAASYPLQLPEFWVVLVVLMGIANTPVSSDAVSISFCGRKKMILVAMMGFLSLCCGLGLYYQKEYYQGYETWAISKMFQNAKKYKEAAAEYKKLVPLMGHRPELLFEAALCLNREGSYVEANLLLYRAMKLSSDPVIHYVAAKNEQLLGNNREAEKILLHVVDFLPERIYPYYLLAKLYVQPEFYQKDKFYETAKAVLGKNVKIESPAIKEMRKEVEKLIRIEMETFQK